MIDNLLAFVQLILIIISLTTFLYILMRGDVRKSNYIMLLVNSCLLWIVLI